MKYLINRLKKWLAGSSDNVAIEPNLASLRNYIDYELQSVPKDSPSYNEAKEVYCLINAELYNSKDKALSACRKCADLDGCAVARNR